MGTSVAPLPRMATAAAIMPAGVMGLRNTATEQGLTLVHFSVQLKRFLWDRGCMQRLLTACLEGIQGVLGGIKGYKGVCRLNCGSETAQVQLKSAGVCAPATEARMMTTRFTVLATECDSGLRSGADTCPYLCST